MVLKRLLPFLVWAIVAFSPTANAQDARWNIDPRATGLGPVIDPASLPQANPNYVNPNKSVRTIQTRNELLTIVPNIRVHPSTITWQSEVPITRHPTNPNIMFASANAVKFGPTFISEGVYVTTDGGNTWFGSDTNSASPVTGHSGDPAPVIDKDGRFIETYLGGSTGMQASYSTDNGLTWAPSVAMPGGSSSDKNFATSDDVPSSPFYGRVYNVWTNFAGTFTNRIVMSFSTNGGVSWSTAAPVSPPTSTGHHHQGCDVRVGPSGQVYVIWANCTTNGQNSTEDSLGFAMSTDGGVTWAVSTNRAADMNGIRAASYFNSIRVSGFPRIDVDRSGGTRNGWIYVVAAEKTVAPATDAGDAILTRSTDGGATWTRSRINQDTPGSGKRQYMAAVTVDLAGGVNVVYYDQRNTAVDSAEVYLSRSLDGGDTWEDILVSDVRFRPTPIAGLAAGYQGDYIGITSSSSKVFPYWCDNRTGIYQAWTAGIQTTEGFGWVKGTITNLNGGAGLSGVSIDFVEPIPEAPGLSSATGAYLAGAKVDTPGTTANLTLRARRFAFLDTTLSITLTRGDTVTRNFAMRPLDLVLTKSSLTFPPIPAPGTSRDSLVARNQGTTSLNLISLSSTNPRFTVSPTSANIPGGDSLKIHVTYSPVLGGTDTGRVIISSNSIFNPRLDVILNGSAIGVPQFTSVVDSFSRTLQGGTLDSVLFRMKNEGTSSGNFLARAIMYPRLGPNGAAGNPIVVPMTMKPAGSQVIEQPRDPISEGYDPSAPIPSSSGTGSLGGTPQYYNFNTGGAANTFPFNITLGKRIQWLFLAGDLAQPTPPPPGRITKLYFRIATAGSGTYTDVSIKLGQTNITALPAGDWYAGPLQTVYTRSSLDLAAAVGEWVGIDLDIPFQYDPLQGLVVDITQCARTGTNLSTFNTTFSGVRRNASLVNAACPLPYANTSAIVVHMGVDLSPGSWLSVAPTTGTVAIGDSVLMTAKFDATDSSTFNNPGDYFGLIEVVATNSSLADTLRIPVHLLVQPSTGVTEYGQGIPVNYALEQNYPNPFNPTTRIEFSLPKESMVHLKIYNILGQEVATLANEQRPAGRFVAEWNAINNSGNKLGSGVYFYRMHATSVSGENSFTSLKKMLILK